MLCETPLAQKGEDIFSNFSKNAKVRAFVFDLTPGKHEFVGVQSLSDLEAEICHMITLQNQASKTQKLLNPNLDLNLDLDLNLNLDLNLDLEDGQKSSF